MQRSCKRGLCIFDLTFSGLSGILCKIPNDESEKPQCIYFKIQPVCGRLNKGRWAMIKACKQIGIGIEEYQKLK